MQETIHYSFRNHILRVDMEGRGGYRYLTSHYLPPKQGERGILFNFLGDNVGGDGRVGYRYQTSHYYSGRVDSKGDSAIHGSSYEEINHSSLLNVG